MDNAQKIWSYLKAQGLTDAGVAGVMGNIYAESGLKPDNLQNSYEGKLGMADAEYTEMVDRGTYPNFVHDKAGYGLCQWTYWSRKEALLAYAKAKGTSIGDLDMQLEFLMKELSGSYKAVLAALKTAASVQAASDAVLLQFERPADQSEAAKARRAGYAQMFYDKFAETGGTGMKLLTCILTNNDCYKTKQTIKPTGVMVHSTGANNPLLRRYVQPAADTPDRTALLEALGTNRNRNDWNRAGTNACVHGFIGKLADGTVAAVQTLPWNHRGWHAGTGTSGKSANNTHISFEICEDALTDPVYFAQAYQTAVELTAMLCKQYNLDPMKDGVVICHQDGYKRGIASNHGDVYNWFPKHGKTMDDFRRDVLAAMQPKPEPAPVPTTPTPAPDAPVQTDNKEDDDMKYYKTLADVPASYQETIKKLMECGALKGRSDPDPTRLDDNILDVSEDYCRIMTTLDRLGKLE